MAFDILNASESFTKVIDTLTEAFSEAAEDAPRRGSSESQVINFGVGINIVLAIIIIINNGLVILAFITSENVREALNIFLFNMAAVDIFHGCLSIPINIGISRTTFFLSTGMSRATCIITYFASNVLWVAGMYNILMVTVYRFVSIIIPLRYGCVLTTKNCCIALVIMWFLVIFYTYLPTWAIPLDSDGKYIIICNKAIIFGNVYAYTFLYLFLYVPLITVVIMYICMYVISRKHNARIAAIGTQDGSQQENSDDTQILKLSKAAKTTFILSATYICCWLPNFISMHIVMDCYFSKCPAGFDITSLHVRNATAVFVFLGYSNAAINPCIYGFRNTVVRRQIKKMFGRCKSFVRVTDQSVDMSGSNSTERTFPASTPL